MIDGILNGMTSPMHRPMNAMAEITNIPINESINGAWTLKTFNVK